ncbi:MAG: hypothetical protein MMC23_001144 [Stictis urceolatum]|nr:hypothetical protein [Stictis urceolata]
MRSLQLILGLASLLAPIQAKDVFAHYLVGTVDPSTDHAQQDVSQALAMGFKGFAMNVGQPTQPWARTTIQSLFDAASGTDFQLFFSMDIYGDGTLSDFTQLVSDFLTHDNYYKAGPSSQPFLSTYSAGSHSSSDWSSFLSTLPTQTYFVPDFDNTDGYYTDSASWFSTWGSLVSGLFSWETAWPAQSDAPSNVSTASDQFVMQGTQANQKTYMISLSSLQYKHLPDQNTHYYRVGEVNLPQRMTEILALSPAPDFVEVVTWNDAGEGHYISNNLWEEGIPQEILDYANAADWPHAGWQPLITSFIGAFGAGKDASAMAPPEGSNAVGTMWYRAILKDAACAADPLGKPGGWQAAEDAVNWAVVVAAGQEGYQVRVTSGGTELQTVPVSAGLNYGATPGMKTGAQKVELLDGSGNAVMTANSQRDVAADSDGICNFNYQVAGMA